MARSISQDAALWHKIHAFHVFLRLQLLLLLKPNKGIEAI